MTRVMLLALALCWAVCAQEVPRDRIDVRGLAGYWPATDTLAEGATWLDRAGTNPGTLTGNATVTAFGGMVGDGTGDYAACGNITALNSATAVTIGAWVKKAAAANDTPMGSFQSSTNCVVIQWYSDGNFYMSPRNGGSTYAYKALTWVSADNWKFLVAVYDGSLAAASRVALYVDGTALSGLTIGGTLPTALSNTVGNGWQVGSFTSGIYLTGTMDLPFVYNRALTASEIARLYNNTLGSHR